MIVANSKDDPMAMPDAFPHKGRMGEDFAQLRSMSDQLRDTLVLVEGRIQASFTETRDEEICYVELWLRQIRDRLKELDKTIARLKEQNGKRALHQWFARDEVVKLYGHSFRLDFHLIPSLPKAKTKARAEVIEWLKAGGRLDCVVMDEGSGEWVFDFDKMEQLVNEMAKEGNRPPASIKLHPKPKIVVRVEK